MDTLTHTVLGACLGEAIAGKRLGRKAMLAGALINNFPDVDVVAQLFSSPAEGLLVHRGITHSIFLNLLLCLPLALLFRSWFKKYGLPLKTYLLLTTSGLFLHIFLDALTSYGTGWLEPFDHRRISFNTLFILDPVFMLPLLIGSIALLILKKTATRRGAWARYCLSISLCYLLLTFCIKLYISRSVEHDLTERQLVHTDYMTTPGPLTNLLWYSAVKTRNGFYVGYHSVLDASASIEYEYIPCNDSLLAPYMGASEVQKVMQFSKGYYTVHREDGHLIFSDLRFGQAGGWCGKQTPFVFNFDIMGHPSKASLQQSRFKALKKGVMKGLFARIAGKKDCSD